MPQITGSIEAHDGGSRTHVKMTMYTFVMITMGLAIATSGVFCLIFLPRVFSNKHISTDIIPYLVFLVLYALVLGGFKSESVTSKSYLVELLEGEIE